MWKCVCLLTFAILYAVPATADGWTTYQNDRFGTALDLPEGLTASPPPQNGDGRSFTSADGRTRIVVFANFWEAASDDWTSYRAWIGETIQNGGGKVMYQADGADWFVYSGKLDGEIFYMRVNRSARCPAIAHHVEIAYPPTDQDRRDAWVERITKSMGEVAAAECP